jgi:hypothetical protein
VPGVEACSRIREARLASWGLRIKRLDREQSDLWLKLMIKAPGQIPKLLIIEISHCDEMNDRIFVIDIDIDMNVWDNARNLIEPISFRRFHVQRNSTTDPYI